MSQANQISNQTSQPLSNINKIQKIMGKINNNKPTEQQMNQLFNAINEEVPKVKEFLEEIEKAPKDDKGQPIIDKNKMSLFTLMFSLFNISKGKYFSEIKPILKMIIQRVKYQIFLI
jgi:hypothetical protein